MEFYTRIPLTNKKIISYTFIRFSSLFRTSSENLIFLHLHFLPLILTAYWKYLELHPHASSYNAIKSTYELASTIFFASSQVNSIDTKNASHSHWTLKSQSFPLHFSLINSSLLSHAPIISPFLFSVFIAH